MLYEHTLELSRQLEVQINFISHQLKQLPAGKFYCTRNGTNYKWFISDGKKSIYIPKKNRPFAEKLAYKKFLTIQLQHLLKRKNALDHFLKYYPFHPGEAEQLFSEHPEYRKLISSFYTPLSQKHLDWMNSPYEHCPKHPEHLTHPTLSGHIVRSKSEAMIAHALYMHKIPFRYEEVLHLRQFDVYPDFSILHPDLGKKYYWEHFGLMDDSNYSAKAFSKLNLYTSNDIIPSVNLITTYETKDHPLTQDTIEKYIRHYFL